LGTMFVFYHGHWMFGINHIQQYAVHRTNNKIPTQVNNNKYGQKDFSSLSEHHYCGENIIFFYGRVIVVRESVDTATRVGILKYSICIFYWN